MSGRRLSHGDVYRPPTFTVARTTKEYTCLPTDRFILPTGDNPVVNLNKSPDEMCLVTVIGPSTLSSKNILTVNGNGKTIRGNLTSFTLSVANASANFLFDGKTWQVF